jgi:hypothetical protein
LDTQEIASQYRLSKWAHLIAECKSSGKKISEWCEENNLSTSSYFYWLRKVRAAACEALPALKNEENAFVPLSFPLPQASPVEPPQVDTPAPAIVVRVDSLSLEIHNSASQELIEKTLRALQHVR